MKKIVSEIEQNDNLRIVRENEQVITGFVTDIEDLEDVYEMGIKTDDGKICVLGIMKEDDRIILDIAQEGEDFEPVDDVKEVQII